MSHTETLRAALIEIRDLSDDFESRHMAVEALAATAPPAQPVSQPPAVQGVPAMTDEELERALFEAYFYYNGECPKAVERNSNGNYKFMTAASSCLTWQDSSAPLLARIEEFKKQEHYTLNVCGGVIEDLIRVSVSIGLSDEYTDVDAIIAEIEKLKEQIATARDDALEAAATICELDLTEAYWYPDAYYPQAIRALKSHKGATP